MRFIESPQALVLRSPHPAFSIFFLLMYAVLAGMAMLFYCVAEAGDRLTALSIFGAIGAVLFLTGIVLGRGRDIRFDKPSGRVTIWGKEQRPLSDVRSVAITSARKGPSSRTFTLALLTHAGPVPLSNYSEYPEAVEAATRIGRFLGIPAKPEREDLGNLIKTVIPPGPKRSSTTTNRLTFGSPWGEVFSNLWIVPLVWAFGAAITIGVLQGNIERGAPEMTPLQTGLLKAALGGVALGLFAAGAFFLRRAALAAMYPPCLFDRARDAVFLRGREVCRISAIRALGWSEDKDPEYGSAYTISVLAGTNEEHPLYHSVDSAFIAGGVTAMAAFVQKPVWKFYE